MFSAVVHKCFLQSLRNGFFRLWTLHYFFKSPLKWFDCFSFVATRDKANIVFILLQSNKEVINSKLNFDFVFFLSLFVGLLNLLFWFVWRSWTIIDSVLFHSIYSFLFFRIDVCSSKEIVIVFLCLRRCFVMQKRRVILNFEVVVLLLKTCICCLLS